MAFTVGDSVVAAGLGPGVVIDVHGAPGGDASHVVRSPATLESRAFRSAELQPGPALRTFEVGDKVQLYGFNGEVIERDGDSYGVEIFLDRMAKHLVLRHFYPRVPAWQLQLGWG